MKRSVATLGLISMLILPTAGSNKHSNTNETKENLIEALSEDINNKENQSDIISFEDTTKLLKDKEKMHELMNNKNIQKILQKYNYSQEDAKNFINELLSSDNGKQFLIELSNDKYIMLINNFGTNAFEKKWIRQQRNTQP